MQIVEGIAGATGVQIDVTDHASLCKYISQVQFIVLERYFLQYSCKLMLTEASCLDLQFMLLEDMQMEF